MFFPRRRRRRLVDRCNTAAAAALTSFTCTCMCTHTHAHTRKDDIRAVTRENAHAHTLCSATDYSAMQSFFGATHPHHSQLSSDVRLRWWTCSPCLSCCRCNVTPLTTFTFTLLLLLLVSFFAAEAVTTLHLQTSGSGDSFALLFDDFHCWEFILL